MKELFFPFFHPPNRKEFKHHGRCNKAAEAMGSTLVQTAREVIHEDSDSKRAESNQDSG